MEYQIITAESTEYMEAQIAGAIIAGWRPQGGIAVSTAILKDGTPYEMFIQAMVRELKVGMHYCGNGCKGLHSKHEREIHLNGEGLKENGKTNL